MMISRATASSAVRLALDHLVGHAEAAQGRDRGFEEGGCRFDVFLFRGTAIVRRDARPTDVADQTRRVGADGLAEQRFVHPTATDIFSVALRLGLARQGVKDFYAVRMGRGDRLELA